MNEEKPDFERAQSAATRLLLQQNIRSLRIDIKKLMLDKSILIDSIQHYCIITGTSKEDYTFNGYSGAYVLKLKTGHHIILYDEDDSAHRQRWGIAHELGHIYLGHNKDERKQEIEANFFAAQLLMPEIVLRYSKKLKKQLSYNDIVTFFDVSPEAARKRIHTLNNKMIHFCDEEKALLKKMIGIVEKEILHFNVIVRNSAKSYPIRAIV